MKNFYVYIMTNYNNSTLYIGVTNDLTRRIFEHKSKVANSFTKKYNLNKLVYFEIFENSMSAIEREKQLKSWSRKKKLEIINNSNPLLLDLFDTLNDYN